MSDHTLLRRRTAPAELVAWYRRSRDRTRAIFQIPVEDAYYDRPILLRNPIVFYEGHLPAFAVNTLVKLARKQPGIDDDFETLFERGIDPEDETAVRDPAEMWPSRSEVRSYGEAADALIERSLLALRDEPVEIEAAQAIIEHEFMHQETLLYMLHNLGYEKKQRPREEVRGSSEEVTKGSLELRTSSLEPQTSSVFIPAGPTTLGCDESQFGWDNEFPQHIVNVAGFEIDRDSVTNADYLSFMAATNAPAPNFWTRVGEEWFWRGMFELIPLPPDWPVYVTHDEASAYARWQGKRLPSEAEYHRAAFGSPAGEERAISEGNFDFISWEPHPVGSHPAGTSAWGVRDLVGNGWEWTGTVFSGFAGFRPMRVYPRYSVDFFDGQHYVLKGGSPATARELIRPSFRNWFRPNYPFVYAKFRCVR